MSWNPRPTSGSFRLLNTRTKPPSPTEWDGGGLGVTHTHTENTLREPVCTTRPFQLILISVHTHTHTSIWYWNEEGKEKNEWKFFLNERRDWQREKIQRPLRSRSSLPYAFHTIYPQQELIDKNRMVKKDFIYLGALWLISEHINCKQRHKGALEHTWAHGSVGGTRLNWNKSNKKLMMGGGLHTHSFPLDCGAPSSAPFSRPSLFFDFR